MPRSDNQGPRIGRDWSRSSNEPFNAFGNSRMQALTPGATTTTAPTLTPGTSHVLGGSLAVSESDSVLSHSKGTGAISVR